MKQGISRDGDPRQQEPGRAHQGAGRLQERRADLPRGHRHRRARHRHRPAAASSSTSSCPTCRKTTCTASAAPAALAPRARRCRWCAWTRTASCATSAPHQARDPEEWCPASSRPSSEKPEPDRARRMVIAKAPTAAAATAPRRSATAVAAVAKVVAAPEPVASAGNGQRHHRGTGPRQPRANRPDGRVRHNQPQGPWRLPSDKPTSSQKPQPGCQIGRFRACRQDRPLPRTVLLAGATGSGRPDAAAPAARASANAATCTCCCGTPRRHRRPPKLELHVVDFAHLRRLPRRRRCTSRLGTTIKTAGSQRPSRQVDHDHVIAIARAARGRRKRLPWCPRSAPTGGSRLLATASKGRDGADAAALGYEWSVSPSPRCCSATAPRSASRRAGRGVGKPAARPVLPLVPRGIRPIAAEDVPAALLARHAGSASPACTGSPRRACRGAAPLSDSLLRHPAFMRFWFARLAGTAANQMLMVAIGWQMYDLTASAWDLGLVGLMQFRPRWRWCWWPATARPLPPARILAACMALQAIVALLLMLGAWHGFASRSLLLLGLSIAIGAANLPAAGAAVDHAAAGAGRRRSRALAFSSAGMQAAIIAGPAIGGFVYAWPARRRSMRAAQPSSCSPARWCWRCATSTSRPRCSAHARWTLLAGVRFVWQRRVVLGAISLDLFAVLLGGATAAADVRQDILHAAPGAWACCARRRRRRAGTAGAGALADPAAVRHGAAGGGGRLRRGHAGLRALDHGSCCRS